MPIRDVPLVAIALHVSHRARLSLPAHAQGPTIQPEGSKVME